MKRKIFIQFLFISTSLISFSQELLPFVENFTKSQYIGDNQVWNSCQGQDNAMYFANNHYLLRYNGVKWEKYTLPNKTIIRSVFSDKDKIYSGSYNEIGYWKRINGKMIYFSLSINKSLFKNDSSNEEIWKIFKFQDKIYFQSFNAIFVFDFKKITKLKVPSLISYCFPVDKKLYVATVNNGIFLLEKQIFSKVNSWNEIIQNIIHSIDVFEGNTYIFTKRNGIYVDTNGVLTKWKNNQLNEKFKLEVINTAKIINQKLVVGTASNGVYIVDLNDNSHINLNRNNSLKNNSVLNISIDLENDLWLGLDNGLSHIEISSPYTIFSDNSGILGSVYSVAVNKNGYLLGSNHGVFDYQNKKLNFINGSEGQVWHINNINNKFLIGHNDGTFIYQNNSFSKINSENGGWKLLQSGFNNNYFQSNYSGILIYESNDFLDFKKVNGLTKPIRNIASNKKNELWAVDSYKSLYRILLDNSQNVLKVENISQKNGIQNDYNVKLFNFKNEILFYCQNTWYKFNSISNKLEIEPQFNANFKNISDIIPIDESRFLILKDGLFYIINQNNAGFAWEFIPLKYYDGKIINEDTKVIVQGNKLIINLDDGFFIYEPNINNLEFHKVKIEGFNDGVLINDDTKIAYNQSVELNIISRFYGFKKQNLFYKINDFDQIKPVNNGNIILNNLESGNQNISIFAIYQGKDVEVGKYEFNVKRPWYFSFLMILIYLLAIFGSFYLYYKWNTIRYLEKIKLKEEELKHQKQILKLELEAENKLKIQELDKHILEMQLQKKASEVAGKSLSIAKQSEMIDKIEFILSNENDINKVKSEIKKSIKINSINKHEWEIFESNLNQVNDEFVNRLNSKYPKLTSKDIKLCIYLKMNLSSKEIAPLMNITFRGVELHRYRLRKKLNIDKLVNLNIFMISI